MIPYKMDEIGEQNAITNAATIQIHNTPKARFFRKLLYEDVFSRFKIGVPKWWDRDFFRYVVFGIGFSAIIKTNLFGVIPMDAQLAGYNVFYRPSGLLIANPLIRSPGVLTIGKDCEVIKMRPDFTGIGDIVSYYGDLMALCCESIEMTVLNSRLSYLIGVETSTEAHTVQSIYDDVISGKPAVVYRTNKNGTMKPGNEWNVFAQNLAQNFIAPQIIDTLNSLHDDFYRIIGIPTLATRKKERTNLDESKKLDFATACKSALWLEEMQEGVRRSIQMFPELDGLLYIESAIEEDEPENAEPETFPDGAV